MGKQVRDYMMKDVFKVMVTTDTSMVDVIKKMTQHNSHAIIVTDINKELEGIITGTDIIRELTRAIDSSILRDGLAKDVMTPKPRVVAEGTLMIDAVDKFFRDSHHALVVVKEYEPVGILSQLDIARWWLDEHSQKTE